MPVFRASASLGSFAAYNFLFVPPRFTFHIERPEDVIMFGMFFVGAHLADTMGLHEGDTIVMDIENRGLNVKVSDDELAERRKAWKRPEPRYTTGVLAKYASLVQQANEGAITKPIL